MLYLLHEAENYSQLRKRFLFSFFVLFHFSCHCETLQVHHHHFLSKYATWHHKDTWKSLGQNYLNHTTPIETDKHTTKKSFCRCHHLRCMIVLCVILTIIHYFKYLNSFFMTGIVAECCCIWFRADTMTFVADCLILLIICWVYV